MAEGEGEDGLVAEARVQDDMVARARDGAGHPSLCIVDWEVERMA